MKWKLLAAAALISFFTMSSVNTASANTVNVYDADDPFLLDAEASAGNPLDIVIQGFAKILPPHTLWGTDGSGIAGNVQLSNTDADEVEQLGGSEAEETTFLNYLLAEIGAAPVNLSNTLKICDNNCTDSFSISTLYFPMRETS